MILLCIEIGPRYCMQYASVRFRAEGPSGLKTGPSGIARPASAPKPGRPRSPTPVYNRASSAPPSAAGPASAGAGYCTTTDRSGSDRSTSNSRLAWVMAQTVCEKNRVRRSVPRSSHTAWQAVLRPMPMGQASRGRTAMAHPPARFSSRRGFGSRGPQTGSTVPLQVPSSRSAAKATFDLRSAPCFFRTFAIVHPWPHGHVRGGSLS